jgi:uncharacterized C2H2 Zn-finger protein
MEPFEILWRCPICLKEWGRLTYLRLPALIEHMERDHGWDRREDARLGRQASKRRHQLLDLSDAA